MFALTLDSETRSVSSRMTSKKSQSTVNCTGKKLIYRFDLLSASLSAISHQVVKICPGPALAREHLPNIYSFHDAKIRKTKDIPYYRICKIISPLEMITDSHCCKKYRYRK